VSTFNVLNKDGSYTCNLRDAFPKIATDIPNCEEAGTMNPFVGLIALFQVNEVLKLITKTGELLTNQLLIYNVLKNSQYKINLKKNNSLDFINIYKDSTYLEASCEIQNPDLLISSAQLKKRMLDSDLEIISVINDLNTRIPFRVHQKIPHKNFNVTKFIPNLNKYYVIICNKGISSYDTTLKLKEKHPAIEVYSLSEGIEKYATPELK
jgi:adenylyltransferase/sulfurtransferase